MTLSAVLSLASLQRLPEKLARRGQNHSPNQTEGGQRSQHTSEPGGLECWGRGGTADSTIIGSETIGHPYGKDKVDPYLTAGLK